MSRLTPASVAAVLAVAFACMPAQAVVVDDLPAADKLIDEAVEFMGGAKSLKGMKSRYMTLSMGPMGTMDMYIAKPRMFLMSQGGMGVMGSDGKVTWRRAMTGQLEIVEGKEAEDMWKSTNIITQLLGAKKDFAKRETVEKTEVGGTPSYKVRLVGEDDKERFAYFSVEKKHLVGMEAPAGEGMPGVMVFREWKKFGDLTHYTRITIEQNGMTMMEMSIDKLEFDKVDKKVFDLPEDVKLLATRKKAPALPDTPGGGE